MTTPRARASGALAPVLAWVLASLLPGGCSSTGTVGSDAGAPRDGTTTDTTLTSDASSDAARDDAGAAADGGVALTCGGSCDPRFPSCGTGGRCTLVGGSPACVPPSDATEDAGTGAGPGAPCAHPWDCALGLACFGTAPMGVCGVLCCDGASDCAPTDRCRGTGALVDGTYTGWGQCLPALACDLIHPERACSDREGCYVVDGTGTTECLRAGSAPTGSPCEGPSDCAPGNVCTGLTARSCVATCSLTSTLPHQGCADTEHCAAQAYSPPGTGICTTH